MPNHFGRLPRLMNGNTRRPDTNTVASRGTEQSPIFFGGYTRQGMTAGYSVAQIPEHSEALNRPADALVRAIQGPRRHKPWACAVEILYSLINLAAIDTAMAKLCELALQQASAWSSPANDLRWGSQRTNLVFLRMDGGRRACEDASINTVGSPENDHRTEPTLRTALCVWSVGN